jgi:type IV pilus assembly protein PilB
MGHQLIGQVLTGMGRLSSIDIDEILEEQAISGMKFGEIAVSLGLCQREQVCEAWCIQLAEEIRGAGLSKVGIDLTAAACVPQDVARRWGVVPIRNFAGMVVMAAGRIPSADEVVALSAMLGREVRFVPVQPEQVDQAIRQAYTRLDISEHVAAHAAA